MFSSKVQRDRLVIWIHLMTIEIYWPHLLHNKSDTGIYAQSQISVKRSTEWSDWMLSWAFVFRLLGFGIGLCWKHCENPYWVKIQEAPI